MEGSLFIPPNRPQRSPDLICAECGQTFRPRRVSDGVEEMCDLCYESQFEPLRLRHWQKPVRLHPHTR